MPRYVAMLQIILPAISILLLLAEPSVAGPDAAAYPIAVGTAAEEGHHLTIERALSTALQRNPSIAQFKEQQLSIRSEENVAAAFERPFVAFEGVSKDGPNSSPGLGLLGIANSSFIQNDGVGSGTDVAYVQNLVDFGRTRHNVQSERFLGSSAGFDVLTQKGWVALTVYRAYDQGLLDEQLLHVAEEDVQRRELVVRQAQARFDAGLISRVDVDLARTDLEQSRVRLLEAQDDLQQAFAELNAAMGVTDQMTYNLDDIPPEQFDAILQPTTTLQEDIETGCEQRPEIRSFQNQVVSLGEKRQFVLATELPLLQSRISAGTLDVQAKDEVIPHNYAAGMLVTWPFLNGGAIRNEAENVRHQEEATRARMENFKQQIQLQVTKARLTLSRLLNSRRAVEEALRHAQDAVKLARTRYEFGLSNLLELEQSELSLLSAETQAQRLKYNTVTAQAELQYATGNVDYSGTLQIVGWKPATPRDGEGLSMGLVRVALRNPYSVIVMALAAVILGVTMLVRLPIDILPQFRTPAVQILTTYSGMPTELMEEDITNRLERWTSQATGVDHQTSRSLLGVSVIRNFFHDDTDPSNALTQVSALAMSDLHYLPPGTLPPIIQLFDPTATMPVALMAVSSDSLSETQLYDVGYYEIRTILSGAQGTIVPAVYGGDLRRIMVYLDKDKLQARNLSPMDVVKALDEGNTMIPTGDANIGDKDYAVVSNAMVPTVNDLNNIPIKFVNDRPIYIRDVGKAEDAFAIQTNAVRVDGRRCVYLPIYRQPGANTIAVVEGVKSMISDLKHFVTNGSKLKLDVILDQSIYVREAIQGLEREGVMGFVLAAVAILLFLGSWNATGIVALTLPLSLLPAFVLLYASGQTINVMTLGGLSLSVGMVMDNAIIVIENIARHIEEGQAPWQAALDGAVEIANPVLIATITMCIVFAPVSLMSGLGKFLFTPLALAVVFALCASYVMSITLVPTASRYFLKGGQGHEHHKSWFERGYTVFQKAYERLLGVCMRHRLLSLALITGGVLVSFTLLPLIGTELFPEVDSGQFIVLLRAPTGTRVEKTEGLVARVEDQLRAKIAPADLHMLVSNIGVPQSLLAGYTPNAGPSDAFILVQLTPEHKLSTQEYAEQLRESLPEAVPGVEFSFDTAGLISSALNLGRLTPIDIQVTGPKVGTAKEIADRLREEVAKIPGAVDVHVQQRLDYPELDLQVDRTRAAAIGLSIEGVVKNLVSALNSSAQFTNNFWVDERNGNNYYIGVTYRPRDINSRQTIADVPINGTTQKLPVPLYNLSTIRTKQSMFEADHLNVRRVIDVNANVQGRDIGAVSGDIVKLLGTYQMPVAYRATLLGEYAAMNESFSSLGFGLILAVLLVYLAMVTQFRSFIDPFIVMFSVPPAFTGVLLMLWMTHTTLNVQSMLGTIMVVGLTVSSSVLIVDFANNRMMEGENAFDAVVEASSIRLRPILMTAIAAMMGLVPTALHSGEANTPLARAVIGGLIVSTMVKMFLLPILYSYWRKSAPARMEEG